MNVKQSALPFGANLPLIYVGTLIIAVLMAVASAAGLLDQAGVYPDEALVTSFAPNDVINLVIGVPMLLASMWLAWRGRLAGLLLWPGALFFVFYTYLIYIFSMPFGLPFLAHLVLVALSAYTMIALLAGIDGNAVSQRLTGQVPDRVGGAVVVVLGLFIFARVVAVFAGALSEQAAMPPTALALNVADFVLSPAWIIGGLLLWRRVPPGYVVGLGLLFQASMLFVGLIVILALQPIMLGLPFPLGDIAAVFVMGLVCFIPFVRFLRGTTRQP